MYLFHSLSILTCARFSHEIITDNEVPQKQVISPVQKCRLATITGVRVQFPLIVATLYHHQHSHFLTFFLHYFPALISSDGLHHSFHSAGYVHFLSISRLRNDVTVTSIYIKPTCVISQWKIASRAANSTKH